MINRFVVLMFHIDTNRINARQKLENMNRLESWARNDVVMLDMAEVTLNEATAGNNPQRTAKAMNLIYSETLATTPNDKKMLTTIEQILFPDGADDDNKRNDVELIFNAAKYERILITNDGGSRRQPKGILGNRVSLKRAVGVKILTEVEAVALVERKILARDALCRRRAELEGTPIPDWVGKD